ncbi:MAG: hypothetical protein M1115_01315 [Actinobacteria bacterium]|nr:hypothetical protein [Actinomycetota bacterium]
MAQSLARPGGVSPFSVGIPGRTVNSLPAVLGSGELRSSEMAERAGDAKPIPAGAAVSSERRGIADPRQDRPDIGSGKL